MGKYSGSALLLLLPGLLTGCHFHFYGCNHKNCHEAGESIPLKVDVQTTSTLPVKTEAKKVQVGPEGP